MGRLLCLLLSGHVEEGPRAVLGRQDQAVPVRAGDGVREPVQAVPRGNETGERAVRAVRQEQGTQSGAGVPEVLGAEDGAHQSLLRQRMAADQEELLRLHIQVCADLVAVARILDGVLEDQDAQKERSGRSAVHWRAVVFHDHQHVQWFRGAGFDHCKAPCVLQAKGPPFPPSLDLHSAYCPASDSHLCF